MSHGENAALWITQKRFKATGAARKPLDRPSVVHSSLYLPTPVYQALREIAFNERVKIHDLVMEGIGAAIGSVGTRRLKS